jgi:hypothetical protein
MTATVSASDRCADVRQRLPLLGGEEWRCVRELVGSGVKSQHKWSENGTAIIDLAGDDPAWRATARRAIVHHPGTVKTIECELYSEKFKRFAAETFRTSVDELCAHHANPIVPKG